jgi:hypothetical protein
MARVGRGHCLGLFHQQMFVSAISPFLELLLHAVAEARLPEQKGGHNTWEGGRQNLLVDDLERSTLPFSIYNI